MARKTIEQRLAELDAQRSALKARLSKTERNNDMRRKVLIGSLVLHRIPPAWTALRVFGDTVILRS